MSEFKITPEMVEAASVETERLTRELDIMNADHIALWLEANDPYDGDAWLAIQIIEAHERATTTLRAENELMREALENVVHPLLYLQRKAESEGARLGGQAYQIANDLPFVQSIARNALAQVAK